MNIETFTIPSLKTHKEVSEFCKNKLKEICEKQYGYVVTPENMGKNEHGKPYFIDVENVHFNISHSKDMGAIVVDDEPCGVDIEQIREVKMSIAKRFFAIEETEWIMKASDEEERSLRFFTVWTGKEAYTKRLGCGLTIKMDSFSVLSEEISPKLKYFQTNNYLVCVCSVKNVTHCLTAMYFQYSNQKTKRG